MTPSLRYQVAKASGNRMVLRISTTEIVDAVLALIADRIAASAEDCGDPWTCCIHTPPTDALTKEAP